MDIIEVVRAKTIYCVFYSVMFFEAIGSAYSIVREQELKTHLAPKIIGIRRRGLDHDQGVKKPWQ